MPRTKKETELGTEGLDRSREKRKGKKEKSPAEQKAEGQATEMFLSETEARLPEAGIENIEPRPELVSGYKEAISRIDLPAVNGAQYGEYYSEQGLSKDELRKALGIASPYSYTDEEIAFGQALEDLYLSGEIIPSRTGGRGGGDWKYRRVERPVPVDSERFEKVKQAISTVLLERTDEYAVHDDRRRALTKDELRRYVAEEIPGLSDVEFSRVLHQLVMDAKIEWNEDKTRWNVRNAEWVRTSRRGLDKEIQRQRLFEGRTRRIAEKLDRAFLEEGWSVIEWARYLGHLPESVAQSAHFWVNLAENLARTIGYADGLSEDRDYVAEHPLEAQQMLESPKLAKEVMRRLEIVGRNAPDSESYEKIVKAYALIVGAEISHGLFEKGFSRDMKESERLLGIPEDVEPSEREGMVEARLKELMKSVVRDGLSRIPQEDRSSPMFWANFNLPESLRGRFSNLDYRDAVEQVYEDVIIGKDELVPDSLRSNVDFWKGVVGFRGYDKFTLRHFDFERRLVTEPESLGISEGVLKDASFWVALLENSIHSVSDSRRGPSRRPTAEEVGKQLSYGYLKDLAGHEDYGVAVRAAKQHWIERYS